MMLKISFQFLCAAALISSPTVVVAASEPLPKSSLDSNLQMQLSIELIAAVNQLRADRGLSQLNAHPILMQVAQAQADYNASIGHSTHTGPDGSRPFQRALAAGYPVAGDLSLGGFYSENIMGGSGLTPLGAVERWMGDAPHQNTMLSEMRSDMGAGVAVVGDFVYYVLDTALASQYSVAYTPGSDESATQAAVFVAPVVASTPRPDGSILHTVQIGESLWTIAAAYKLKVDQITFLNSLNPQDFIHPGDQLVIRQVNTPTPTRSPLPSTTPSLEISRTSVIPLPTQTTNRELDEIPTLPFLLLTASILFAGLALLVWVRYR